MHFKRAEGLFNCDGDWRQTAMPAGFMDNPLSNTGIALGSLKSYIRLSRRVQVFRRMIGLKSKTLVRILLTKWWDVGLEWYERELFEILARESRVLPELYILRELKSSKLSLQVEQYYFWEKDQDWFFPQLFKLLYNPNQLKAVSGLRRVKKFFSLAYERRAPEQTGKPKLKRARIRGYRDGKGKPMDQGLKSVVEANLYHYNLIERFFLQEEERMNLDCSSRGPTCSI